MKLSLTTFAIFLTICSEKCVAQSPVPPALPAAPSARSNARTLTLQEAEAVALYYLLAIHETAVNCRVLG